ncbi:MAG: polysaccharide biosynthesis protein [Enhydrobacter sp.]|nr:MAG: polysaccharide biosynthesis protein [Enhydrobacter sp.]
MAGIANTKNIRVLVFGYDVAMSVLALLLALWVRHGSLAEMDDRSLFLGGVLPFAAATAVALLVMRTYRTSWRHASTADLTNIFYTVTLAVLVYLPMSFVVTRLDLIPRSSIVMVWMAMFLLMGGSRVAYRLYRERGLFFRRRPMLPHQVPILVVGGGIDADLLLRGLQNSSEYYPVGVLDDAGHGTLRGVPVLGRIADVERVVEGFAEAGDRPRKLVVVDHLLAPATLDRLVEVANRLGLTVARGPDPTQFRPGTSDASELRPISVEDLLGRSQIVLDPEPVRHLVAGKRVLVTGAGGSIGAEIVRQVCAIGPAALCLVDSSEFNLYSIDTEVSEQWPALERIARVVDVRHRPTLEACFASFGPDIVFHAAALKHVPLVEGNPVEGIWTNVIGSRHVCDAAIASRCHALVLVSTDKAVNPTNVMGATKRCAEGYCQALALEQAGRPEGTRVVVVRFGNVLGSTGSVVPLFERQLKAGGPLTVTHPDMERYFMTIREAVQLVLQASALGAARTEMAGRVFVLDMGKPVRIADLARQMIRLAGLRPAHDIQIRYTGLRPGEKLSEELFHESERMEATGTPRLNVASPRALDLARYRAALESLDSLCAAGREGPALELLATLVPEYRSPREVAAQ